MGSHFLGDYRLDFLRTGQEINTSILQALEENEKVLNLSVLDIFLQRYVEKGI